MGLLAEGTPYSWSEAKKHSDHVRAHGITQFLQIWARLKDRTGDVLLWGDEVSSNPELIEPKGWNFQSTITDQVNFASI